MLIKVREKIYLTGYTQEQADKIKNKLTISNPLFVKKSNLKLALFGIDPTLKFYEEKDDTLIVPVGIFDEVKSLLPDHKIIDNRFKNKNSLDIKFTGILRDYQEKAVNELSKYSNGVLEAITASGKTLIICALIAKVKQPSLILVHTKELKDQFIDKLKKFTNINTVGTIGDTKYDIQDITVALLQSMHRLSEEQYKELNNRFGFIYLDEAHIAPAETFYSALNKLTALYKYGGSGTPYRTDGLTKVIFFVLGPIIHKVPISDVKDYLSEIDYEQIETGYFFPMIASDEYTVMMNELTKDDKRNKFIADYAKDYLDKSCVFLSTRVQQLEELQELLETGTIITSKTPKKKREKIIKDFLTKKINIIFSTYQLFSTGLDIDHLEYLFFCAPMRSEIIIRQSVGRLMRKYIGKQAKIIDFVDTQLWVLKHQARARKKILENLKESLLVNR